MANLDEIGYGNVFAQQNSYEPVPAGMYTAAIVASELKPTKDYSGKYLELKHQILDGQYKGRTITARINVQNQNSQAQEIAQKQLGELKFVFGSARDTSEWHNKPVLIKVAIRPASGGYEASNDIKNWFKVGGVEQTPAPTQATGAAWRTPPAQPGQPVDDSVPF